MKKISFLLLLLLFMIAGCNVDTKVNGIPQDKEKRAQLYGEIINNEDYFSEFMNMARDNRQAMNAMRGNQMMMHNMMQGQGMHQMMQNRQMRQNMMQMMMTDSTAMKDWMQMMQQKKMMTEDCKQIIREHMQEMMRSRDSVSQKQS